MKKAMLLLALCLHAAAWADPDDNWITFGLDNCRYLDGAAIEDGEQFALVWTDCAAATNEVMRLALAEDGFCPTALFNVTPAKTGGIFLVYQLDSRGTGNSGAKLVATAEVATQRVVAAKPFRGVVPGFVFHIAIAKNPKFTICARTLVFAKMCTQRILRACKVICSPDGLCNQERKAICTT